MIGIAWKVDIIEAIAALWFAAIIGVLVMIVVDEFTYWGDR